MSYIDHKSLVSARCKRLGIVTGPDFSWQQVEVIVLEPLLGPTMVQVESSMPTRRYLAGTYRFSSQATKHLLYLGTSRYAADEQRHMVLDVTADKQNLYHSAGLNLL